MTEVRVKVVDCFLIVGREKDGGSDGVRSGFVRWWFFFLWGGLG